MPSTLAERLEAHAKLARQAHSSSHAHHPGAAASAGEAGWSQPRADILASWARCTSSGLDLAHPPSIEVVSSAELARRRDEHDFVRRLALAELETLQQQIAGSNFLLAFADREGVILDLYADQRFAMSGNGEDIMLGSRWTEASRGTNGLGTALATGRAVAVTGPEHYFIDLRHVSCIASPVRDALGQVVGVLDASSYVESRQRHTQALVQMAASQIENRLLVHQMRKHWVLAIHPRAEFLGTLSAGLLAFDGAGRLSAANERARALLSGLELDGQTRFEELFREPLEHLLGRLHRHHGQNQSRELRLCDALGSVLHARCVSGIGGDDDLHRGSGHGRHRSSNSSQLATAGPNGNPSAVAPAKSLPPLGSNMGAGNEGDTRTSARRLRLRHDHLRDFVIDDAQVQDALNTVGAAVRLQAPILIRGESGSGKEMLARHAHAMSGRSGEFVAVNCAALPTELFEAELFGYVGGAYTGARREGDVGLIVSADGGTLLLDEIRELGPTAQAALLRFLDDQQVRPVGGHHLRKVNVQLLAATHADLQTEVVAGHFRADLFYRLGTVAVSLPPLRARSDFSAVVEQLLGQLDAQARLDAEALDLLRHQPWPGNFRELRAVLTRALLRCSDHHIDKHAVTPSLNADAGNRHHIGGAVSPEPTALLPTHPGARRSAAVLVPTASALQQGATAAVLAEYQRSGGSVSATSRVLGISRTTVYRHLHLAGAI
jgi:transcriptional regulator of acetoin/glycerol metabolism